MKRNKIKQTLDSQIAFWKSLSPTLGDFPANCTVLNEWIRLRTNRWIFLTHISKLCFVSSYSDLEINIKRQLNCIIDYVDDDYWKYIGVKVWHKVPNCICARLRSKDGNKQHTYTRVRRFVQLFVPLNNKLKPVQTTTILSDRSIKATPSYIDQHFKF